MSDGRQWRYRCQLGLPGLVIRMGWESMSSGYYRDLRERLVLFLCAVCIFASAPGQLSAQSSVSGNPIPLRIELPLPSTAYESPPSGSEQTAGTISLLTVQERSSSVGPYVLIGAGVGAAVGAVYGWRLAHDCAECMVSPVLVVGVPMLAGAGAGALLGYLFYLAKR